MEKIYKIITFPVTLSIAILCLVGTTLFSWELVREAKTRDASYGVAFLRVQRESQNTWLMDRWQKIHLLGRAIISMVIYYNIFL